MKELEENWKGVVTWRERQRERERERERICYILRLSISSVADTNNNYLRCLFDVMFAITLDAAAVVTAAIPCCLGKKVQTGYWGTGALCSLYPSNTDTPDKIWTK